MPKKKLTKTQVKRKFQQLAKITYDLASDKMGYGTKSHIPMSFDALANLNNKILRIRDKL